MIEIIQEHLNAMATVKTKEFSERIISTPLPILGVKTPDLRKLAKQIIKGDYLTFLEECDASSYEMKLLEGIVIASAPLSLEAKFKYLDRFIPTIRDWAIHDGLVSSLKCSNRYPKEMLNYILKYQKSEQEFEVRFVAVMLMTYYLKDEYVQEAFDIVKTLNLHTYYAKMGVAWFIATAMIKYQNLALDYLKESKDAELITMCIRKIRDSFRVNDEIKNKVLEFKK